MQHLWGKKKLEDYKSYFDIHNLKKIESLLIVVVWGMDSMKQKFIRWQNYPSSEGHPTSNCTP